MRTSTSRYTRSSGRTSCSSAKGALPYGLNTAPSLFSMVVNAFAGSLHQRTINFHHYLRRLADKGGVRRGSQTPHGTSTSTDIQARLESERHQIRSLSLNCSPVSRSQDPPERVLNLGRVGGGTATEIGRFPSFFSSRRSKP